MQVFGVNIFRLYFSPKDILEKREFARGCAALIMVWCILSMIWCTLKMAPIGTRNFLLIDGVSYVRLALIYPFFCIWTKRFHSSGKGWVWGLALAFSFFVLCFVIHMAFVAYFISSENYMSQMKPVLERIKQVGGYKNPRAKDDLDLLSLLQSQTYQKVYFPTIGTQLFFLILFNYGVGRLKLKTKDNKYAPDYEDTFS